MTPMQYKATTLDGSMHLYVEAARGAGRRHFIATHGAFQIRLPISDDVTDERVIPVMMARLEARLLDLLDHLTAPKHGVAQQAAPSSQ